MPADPEKICYVYSALTTCNISQMDALAAGTAIVKDWVVVGIEAARERLVDWCEDRLCIIVV